jgi:hypothetical protein
MNGRKRSEQHLSVNNLFMNNIKRNVMNSILNNKKIRIFSLVMVLASMTWNGFGFSFSGSGTHASGEKYVNPSDMQ